MIHTVDEMYEKYVIRQEGGAEFSNLLSACLKSYDVNDVVTLEEHKKFLEALRLLRISIANATKLNGKNFLSTISSLLSVGNDGLYSSNLRFIYELIQNVDDCDYINPEDCHLDIQFEFEPQPGKIIFTYNETGFKPFNVFAITGIAEESKNITSEKMEIGEKGIGFKSVFGVASKVHIESGYFSFVLEKDNFTVPILMYEDFEFVKGTRLTLYLDNNQNAKNFFRDLVKQYAYKSALLNKNPILFLNKLTYLNIHQGENNFIKFEVQKSEKKDSFNCEEDVLVSIDLKSNVDNIIQNNEDLVSCKRYTLPVSYGEKECKSRYGSDISFKNKRHNIIALFPNNKEIDNKFTGVMYSFLPTQIKLNGPFVLHVPFKLDGSREFVDSQGNNAWFVHTCNMLEEFFEKVYKHIANLEKEDITYYLPKYNDYIFKKDNEKVNCLCIDGLHTKKIYNLDIFFCYDKSFQCSKLVASFSKMNEISNKEQIFRLLNLDSHLFVPTNERIDMINYGVRIINDIPRRLFVNGMNNEDMLDEIADVLDKWDEDINYQSYLKTASSVGITMKQLCVISNHPKMAKDFFKYALWFIKNKVESTITIIGKKPKIYEGLADEIRELVESADLDKSFEEYLKLIDYKFVKVPGVCAGFVLPLVDCIVISEDKSLSAFSKLTAEFDSGSTFTATLQIKQASEQLNNIDDGVSNSEYLKLLRGVRSSLVTAYGKRAYENFISIINNAAANRERFLFELLQNADDCLYSDDVVPEFNLTLEGNILTTSYNEKGFSKANVRAITAIGESTKKLILGADKNIIGEKGIGFKSVFAVAKSVEIHSNGFDFLLKGEKPTVPEKCECKSNAGTIMIYDLKKSDIRRSFSEASIVQACLCLRKLKKINIDTIKIVIDDLSDKRIIYVNGKEYIFEKYQYDFQIKDKQALEERNTHEKIISEEQSIFLYLPPKEYKTDSLNIYAGLPVEKIACLIPAVIDAPFELTTARDDVLECKWNDYVKTAIYKSLIQLIEKKKEELRLEVLKYVGYQNQNNSHSFVVFSSSYLNRFDWIEQLKKMSIVPNLKNDKFAKPDTDKYILSDYIIKLYKHGLDIKSLPSFLVDSIKGSKYITLLELLGCKRISIEDDLRFFEVNLTTILKNEKLRNDLYKHLSEKRTEIENKGLLSRIKQFKIYPARTRNGHEFVAFNDNFYTHESKVSDDSFTILETNIMPYETIQSILGMACRINELNQKVYDAQYRENLEEMITECTSKEKVAKYLLNEYNSNLINLSKCKNSLFGLRKDIPMLMENGEYRTGRKFVNKTDSFFAGELIQSLCVDENYRKFAEYIGCIDIHEAHYSDLEEEIDVIEDEDLEDLLDDFKYFIDIISGLIMDDLLSDEQIIKFNLQAFDKSADSSDVYEDFPSKQVVNWSRLKSHLKETFNSNPNPYVQKRRIVKEPQYKVDKKQYTTSMYYSRNNPKKCFCQMCEKLHRLDYIERNDVQKEPKYGWSQMYLSLCLNCSKDYILLRNNPVIWKQFIDGIKSVNVSNQGKISVPIGDRTIRFTATHIAEIQEIIKLEEQDNRTFNLGIIDAIDEIEEEPDVAVVAKTVKTIQPSTKNSNQKKQESIVEYTSIENLRKKYPSGKLLVVKKGWTNDYCFCVDEFEGQVKANGKIFLNGKYRETKWFDRRHKEFKIYTGPSRQKIEQYY